MDKVLRELRDRIRARVREGFDSREIILDDMESYCQEEYDLEDLGPAIRRILDDAFAEHFRAQAGWDGPTDCDRLDRAFAALEEEGIVARQNFTCCQTCGNAEIGAEIANATETNPDRPVIGYTFYHMQDTESAVEGGGLYLAYGAEEDGVEPMVDVGQRIVRALEAAGLQTQWNGSYHQRILVRLDWKRRREPREAE